MLNISDSSVIIDIYRCGSFCFRYSFALTLVDRIVDHQVLLIDWGLMIAYSLGAVSTSPSFLWILASSWVDWAISWSFAFFNTDWVAVVDVRLNGWVVLKATGPGRWCLFACDLLCRSETITLVNSLDGLPSIIWMCHDCWLTTSTWSLDALSSSSLTCSFNALSSLCWIPKCIKVIRYVERLQFNPKGTYLPLYETLDEPGRWLDGLLWAPGPLLGALT